MAQGDKATGLIATQGIELLTSTTPNGFKASIFLEELKNAYGKQYTYQNIDIFQGVQKEPWYTALNPNGRIPIIVDHDKGGFIVMETLAILNYLARHYDLDYKFSFEDPLEASTAEQWMAWSSSHLSPIAAQAWWYYRHIKERFSYPIQSFVVEAERLYGVLDMRLAHRDYLAGSARGKYSIADIANWTFIDSAASNGIELEKFPNLYNWWSRINDRQALQKGTAVPSGEPFPFGYKAAQRMWKEDPEGTEERERPLKEALEKARKEYEHEPKGP